MLGDEITQPPCGMYLFPSFLLRAFWGLSVARWLGSIVVKVDKVVSSLSVAMAKNALCTPKAQFSSVPKVPCHS